MTAINLRDIIVAGTVAEGHGALAGWSGLGSLSRRDILASLDEAGLSTELAPAAKSDVGHAGQAIGALNAYGFISRRAKTPRWESLGLGRKRRAFRARWSVVVADASEAQVGQPVGRVVLTAELRDGSSELHLDGHADLARQIRERYEETMAGEFFSAGDVTAWLSRTLINTFGCARFAVGYFVPAASRAQVEALCGALAKRWGASWIHPLLPVADSEQLRAGLARGFFDEIARIERSVENAESKEKLTETTAASFLRDLATVDERADAYRALCGDTVMAPAAARLRTLSEKLREKANDAAVRFALLDLSGPTAAEREAAAPAPKLSPAEKAAEKAWAERGHTAIVEPAAYEIDEDQAARFANLDLGTAIVEAPEPEPEPVRPLELDLDTPAETEDPAGPIVNPEPSPEPEIIITEDHYTDEYVIKSPFSRAAKQAWRRIPGRRWDKANRVNRVPTTSRNELFAFLRTYFGGCAARGPKGNFTL